MNDIQSLAYVVYIAIITLIAMWVFAFQLGELKLFFKVLAAIVGLVCAIEGVYILIFHFVK